MRLLIKAGADINAKDKDGKTAFMWAYPKCILPLVKAGVEDVRGERGVVALRTVASEGDADCVRQLIKAKVDVNAKDGHGQTALMDAAFWGHTDCLRLLIQAGADVNVKDKDGKTALTWAEAEGKDEIVSLLRDAGAQG